MVNENSSILSLLLLLSQILSTNSSLSEGHSFLEIVSCSFYIHCTLRGVFSHEVFLLSSLYFNVYFVFGYLTWPCCHDPLFIFTIVMFRVGVGVTSHTPRISFS